MNNKFALWFSDYLEILYPCRCAACQVVIPVFTVFCKECLSEIESICPPVCRCGAEMTEKCSCLGRDFEFVNNTAVLRYGFRVKQSIDNLKTYRVRYIGRQLGRLLAQALAMRKNADYTLVTAVPLHKNRRKRRGFNQSEIIAAEVSSLLGIRRDFSAIKRIKDTRSQRGLSGYERKNNVDGAFWADPEKVKNQTVLLIDDVFTTGATMQECAKELKKSGAKAVYCAAAAKTFKKS